jgi:hypothetical protein
MSQGKAMTSSPDRSRQAATEAVLAAAAELRGEQTFRESVLREMVDIAYKYQFSPTDRGQSRKDLQALLEHEVARMDPNT